MAAKGWNQKTLAQESGINQPNLNRIISGTQGPTIPRLQAIADAFGIQVYELIRLAEQGQEADARKALLHRLVDDMTPDQIENAFRRLPDSSADENTRISKPAKTA